MSIPSEKDTIILTGTVGSHSYGTATLESDLDYMSLVIASPDVYFGLNNWGNSGTMDDEHEDPIQGLVEHKYFEIKKAVSMFESFNPNIISLLWLQPNLCQVVTPAGELLLKNRTLFNSKRAYHTFSGYAYSQLQKMGGVFNDNEESNRHLKDGYLQFENWAKEKIHTYRLLRDTSPLDAAAAACYNEGYLNALITLRSFSEEQRKRIKDGPITGRMGEKRKHLREKYGYDVKFACHTIRLMTMCVEFLKQPEDGLKVYRFGIDSNLLCSIRAGKFTPDEIKDMADDLFAQARDAVNTSPLPDVPDHAAIHNLTMDLIRLTLAT